MNGNCACNNLITLRWLNTLGGWEYWTFTARHTYGVNISNVNTFNIDIFQNWDTNFIAGEVEEQTLSLNAADSIQLRTGLMNKSQSNGVATIKYGINVQTVSGEFVNSDQTVTIDRSSFQYRTDKEKQIELSFNISLPKIQIQTA